MLIGSLTQVSNRQDWDYTFDIVDDDTGDMIDLTSASIAFEIRDQRTGTSVLATSTNNGITLPDNTTALVSFTKEQMRTLRAGTYDVGCTILNEDKTAQIIIGTLPVFDGVIS